MLLLGQISGNTSSDTRILPAADHEYPFMYCVEAHSSPVDHRAVASSPEMLVRNFGDAAATPTSIRASLGKQISFDGPSSLSQNGQLTKSNNAIGMCGCYIEAVYRPLSTIYTGSSSTASNAFDYLDPQFYRAAEPFQSARV